MNKQVVIVNHSTELGRLFSHMLRTRGYPVSLYQHWQQALDEVAGHPPAAVVLDKHMAGANVRTMCAQLRQYCPDTPILIWGLDWTPDETRELNDCGVGGFLQGPVPTETLATHVHHAVHGFDHRKIA